MASFFNSFDFADLSDPDFALVLDSDDGIPISTVSDDSGHTVFYDTVTGVRLDNHLVEEAMQEEIRYMQSLPVWQHCATRSDLPEGCKIVGHRWVIVNKGDASNPKIRARLVATEVKHDRGVAGHDPNLFSATPPLEALRILLSMAASNEDHVFGQIDVRKAHLYGRATRRVAVQLPKLAGSGYGLLLRTLYGTRDAASAWETEIARVMRDYGLLQGKSSPCIWRSAERNFALLIHGDDLVFTGPRVEFDALAAFISKSWELDIKGCLGRDGNKRDLRILGRLLSFHQGTYQMEADPRHVDILIRSFDVQKSCVAPGVKSSADEEDTTPLEYDKASLYRSQVMRAAYLSLDRPELSFSVQQCAKGMCNPTVSDHNRLKHIARFLKDSPRVVQVFKHQKLTDKLIMECDSDFAGDSKSRKSTSGLCAFLGNHCILSSCKNQSVIALSSGEAEFYALGSAITRGLGLKSLLADFGWSVNLTVRCDSTAAIGLAGRRGLGKAKHIATVYLWIQVGLKDGLFKLEKVDGDKNRSDLMTKYLARDRLSKLLDDMGFVKMGGRHDLALDAASFTLNSISKKFSKFGSFLSVLGVKL